MTELFFASSEMANDPEKELPGTSIYEAVKPRLLGDSKKTNPASVELVESEIYKNLFLLKGDLEFSRAETCFARAWNEAITEDVHEKSIYTVLYRLLSTLGEEGSFDYVLCDVAPSTGAMTRMAVLACDGFFLPFVPDRFSYHSALVLGNALTEWIKRHEEVSKTFDPFRLESFPGDPKLLGAILQKFKVHDVSHSKHYLKWQERIESVIKSTLLSDGRIKPGPKLDRDQPFIATIEDVGPLASISLIFGRAIFDVDMDLVVKASDGAYADLVWHNWEERREEYREEIRKIAGALP